MADIRMDHDFPTERRAFFEPSGNPGGTVLIHSSRKISGASTTSFARRERAGGDGEENIRARVSAILGDIGHDKTVGAGMVERLLRQHAVPRRYRHGRVFFIGDAAHIVPIFGVRGLNDGLADAENLG